MKNKAIREYAKSCGVRLWEVAEAYGLSDQNFSRKLRHELPDDEQQKIMRIIDEIHSRRR